MDPQSEDDKDAAISPRRGAPDVALDRETFRRRFLSVYTDPVFEPLQPQLDEIAEAAWDAYWHYRKSPRTRKAGSEFADATYELATDWLTARAEIQVAAKRHADPSGPTRILLINASPRSDQTCPGEVSKSYRLARIADDVLKASGTETELLDLSRVTAEYGRQIHPCKACFSTSPALCHWPCSCYPNYSLGQVHDWMNEIYPMWVAAHGVMIITPVHWYQTPSLLKLMMDRLVCADGGNPDPTTTHGKNAREAKEIELQGWDYPRHLAGRVFSIVVHGDAGGAQDVRRNLSDWLEAMGLTSAGSRAELDRYVGYWKPYATSHLDLDADSAFQEEVRDAAQTLIEAVRAKRSGNIIEAGTSIKPPRDK